MGCRFYLGSDAHHPADLVGNRQAFEEYIDKLKLQEGMRFMIVP
jgi:histidinol phosphatase-like PHP family hydrolase